MRSFIFLISIVMAGCFTFNPDREYLSGEWTDFEEKEGTIYFAGNKLNVKFRKNSFYYHVEKWTDIVRENDTCRHENDDRYFAGKYKVSIEKFYFMGFWTNYKYDTLKLSKCVEKVKFELTYRIVSIDENSIELKLLSPIPYLYDWRYRDKLRLMRK
ncbi:MAG: hypothetical protein ABI543_10030 [Ignavibacteria bacterium]